MSFQADKLKAFLAKQKGARTGGKGSVRRKQKVVRKTAGADEKRMKTILQKLNVRDIPAIEEVNMFMEGGDVIHFEAPKVQASITANTYIITGEGKQTKITDLLPGIMTQMGPESMAALTKLYQQMGGDASGVPAMADDDDVPDLVENFEDAEAMPDLVSAQ